jgi:hypothetical protein
MKKVTLIFICLSMIGGMSFTNSCKKDNKIKGCMDKDSYTYSAAAQEDNGSCLYEGEVVIWYDQAASTGLMGVGATALTYYLNGEVVGSSASSVYWTVSSDCGANGSITATEDLGKVKTHAYTLSVKDQTGIEQWNTVINIDANTCLQFQLLWSKRKK